MKHITRNKQLYALCEFSTNGKQYAYKYNLEHIVPPGQLVIVSKKGAYTIARIRDITLDDDAGNFKRIATENIVTVFDDSEYKKFKRVQNAK